MSNKNEKVTLRDDGEGGGGRSSSDGGVEGGGIDVRLEGDIEDAKLDSGVDASISVDNVSIEHTRLHMENTRLEDGVQTLTDLSSGKLPAVDGERLDTVSDGRLGTIDDTRLSAVDSERLNSVGGDVGGEAQAITITIMDPGSLDPSALDPGTLGGALVTTVEAQSEDATGFMVPVNDDGTIVVQGDEGLHSMNDVSIALINSASDNSVTSLNQVPDRERTSSIIKANNSSLSRRKDVLRKDFVSVSAAEEDDDEEEEEIGRHCFVCNIELPTENEDDSVSVFKTQTTSSLRKVSVILSSLVGQTLTARKAHSDIMCRRCFSLLDRVDTLEVEIKTSKEEIVTKFQNTIALYGGRARKRKPTAAVRRDFVFPKVEPDDDYEAKELDMGDDTFEPTVDDLMQEEADERDDDNLLDVGVTEGDDAEWEPQTKRPRVKKEPVEIADPNAPPKRKRGRPRKGTTPVKAKADAMASPVFSSSSSNTTTATTRVFANAPSTAPTSSSRCQRATVPPQRRIHTIPSAFKKCPCCPTIFVELKQLEVHLETDHKGEQEQLVCNGCLSVYDTFDLNCTKCPECLKKGDLTLRDRKVALDQNAKGEVTKGAEELCGAKEEVTFNSDACVKPDSVQQPLTLDEPVSDSVCATVSKELQTSSSANTGATTRRASRGASTLQCKGCDKSFTSEVTAKMHFASCRYSGPLASMERMTTVGTEDDDNDPKEESGDEDLILVSDEGKESQDKSSDGEWDSRDGGSGRRRAGRTVRGGGRGGRSWRGRGSRGGGGGGTRRLFSAKGRPECEVCGEVCTSASALYSHTHRHHPEMFPFRCSVCDRRFRHQPMALEHERRHSVGALQCPACGLKFSRLYHLHSHIKDHHPSFSEFPCQYCQRITPTVEALQTHLKLHHAEQLGLTRDLQCQTCGETFHTGKALSMHRSSKHAGKAVCGLCGALVGARYLNKHINAVHTKEKTHHCIDCEKTFYSRTSLMGHRKRHHVPIEARKHLCHMCGKGYVHNVELQRHLKAHRNQRDFKCDFCARTFLKHGDLTYHRRLHTGERPHACSICSEAFMRPVDLRKHTAKHLATKKNKRIKYSRRKIDELASGLLSREHEDDEPVSSSGVREEGTTPSSAIVREVKVDLVKMEGGVLEGYDCEQRTSPHLSGRQTLHMIPSGHGQISSSVHLQEQSLEGEVLESGQQTHQLVDGSVVRRPLVGERVEGQLELVQDLEGRRELLEVNRSAGLLLGEGTVMTKVEGTATLPLVAAPSPDVAAATLPPAVTGVATAATTGTSVAPPPPGGDGETGNQHAQPVEVIYVHFVDSETWRSDQGLQ